MISSVVVVHMLYSSDIDMTILDKVAKDRV